MVATEPPAGLMALSRRLRHGGKRLRQEGKRLHHDGRHIQRRADFARGLALLTIVSRKINMACSYVALRQQGVEARHIGVTLQQDWRRPQVGKRI